VHRLSRLKTGFRATLLLGVSLAALSPLPAHATSGTLTELGSLGGQTGGYGSENDDGYGGSISNDGSVAVGDAVLADNSVYHAFRWTQAGGMGDLGTLGGTNSYAAAVSADGSVVVGAAELIGDSAYHAFRWTQAGGMGDLGTLGGTFSFGYGVSADGSVVVGVANITGDSATHAFRWTQAGGMGDLGTLGGTNSNADGISADGSVVVGGADLIGDSATHAFRWTQAGGMGDLGTLGGTNSQAAAVSSTGKVVAGYSQITGNSTQDAFRWTQATGMQDLNTLLSNAGVNMTGIQLQYVGGISADGKYIAVTGNTPNFPGGEALVVFYDDGNEEAALTTAADVQASTQALSSSQRAALVESHATAGELLGMTRPVDNGSYTYAGAMFGSALGYTGGQYSAHGVTIMGGIAYGSEDYPDITQGNAPTVAAAVRYTFDDPFGDAGKALHPYAELGGWVTPQAPLTLTRSYANGSGTSTGQGGINATSWAEYGRGGLIWDVTAHDRLTGYGELGQQYMSFGAYSENSTNNPFPASVGAGLLRLGVARIGGLWTHKIDDLFDQWDHVPVSVTLAGNVAQSFNVHSGLTATVAGVGSTEANNGTDTWGEFGGRVTAGLTKNIDLNLDLNGTTGGGALGTAIHGGVGVTYSF
jgi:probable HAF family extracellular repeat protein